MVAGYVAEHCCHACCLHLSAGLCPNSWMLTGWHRAASNPAWIPCSNPRSGSRLLWTRRCCCCQSGPAHSRLLSSCCGRGSGVGCGCDLFQVRIWRAEACSMRLVEVWSAELDWLTAELVGQEDGRETCALILAKFKGVVHVLCWVGATPRAA